LWSPPSYDDYFCGVGLGYDSSSTGSTLQRSLAILLLFYSVDIVKLPFHTYTKLTLFTSSSTILYQLFIENPASVMSVTLGKQSDLFFLIKTKNVYTGTLTVLAAELTCHVE
jgi:hypothetical protein